MGAEKRMVRVAGVLKGWARWDEGPAGARTYPGPMRVRRGAYKRLVKAWYGPDGREPTGLDTRGLTPRSELAENQTLPDL